MTGCRGGGRRWWRLTGGDADADAWMDGGMAKRMPPNNTVLVDIHTLTSSKANEKTPVYPSEIWLSDSTEDEPSPERAEAESETVDRHRQLLLRLQEIRILGR